MAVQIFDGSEWVPSGFPWPDLVVRSRETHTYAVEGALGVISHPLPFFVSVHPQETLSLIEVICRAGTGSANLSIQKNWEDIPAFTNQTIDTTERVIGPASVNLEDRDELRASISDGEITWTTITLVLERTTPVVSM